MGLLSDLQMGLGLKDRDRKYYEDTAQSIENQRGEAASRRYRDRVGLDDGTKLGSKKMPFRGGLLSNMKFGEYTSVGDMFDRGGPNAKGGVFQGGGLLSDIANMLFGTTQQTSGFGTSAKILGKRRDETGLSRPFDNSFHTQYRTALANNLLPPMTTYDDYYDKMFP